MNCHTIADSPVSTSKPAKRRFAALDVFRGLAIFVMILVNTAGPGHHAYRELSHAPWFGFTLADFVFPSFLFATGASMSFALDRASPLGVFSKTVLRRAALIVLLGIFMYWYPFVEHHADGWVAKPFSETRLTGVLQRIGICYAIAAFSIRWLNDRQLILASVAILVGYWLIVVMASPPGEAFDKLGNIGTQIDLSVFGPDHLYKKDHGFDPEGLLGCLPGVVNVIAGYLGATMLRRSADVGRFVKKMALVGLVLTVAALAWTPYDPIAKKLWTSSYTLLTIGLDLLLLAVLTPVTELSAFKRINIFFEIVGRNPLVLYLFSELFVVTLDLIRFPGGETPYKWLGIEVFQAIAPGSFGSFLCALFYTMICWVLGWWLYRKKIIIKI